MGVILAHAHSFPFLQFHTDSDSCGSCGTIRLWKLWYPKTIVFPPTNDQFWMIFAPPPCLGKPTCPRVLSIPIAAISSPLLTFLIPTLSSNPISGQMGDSPVGSGVTKWVHLIRESRKKDCLNWRKKIKNRWCSLNLTKKQYNNINLTAKNNCRIIFDNNKI